MSRAASGHEKVRETLDLAKHAGAGRTERSQNKLKPDKVL